MSAYFYPRSPCGERPASHLSKFNTSQNFYPRSPCGERLAFWCFAALKGRDFYPRSPCGERLEVNNPVAASTSISIHALLAESDRPAFFYIAQHTYFYPRSPCGERRQQPAGTTRTTYFYPRSPCGERPHANRYYVGLHLISIHALLAESDKRMVPLSTYTRRFLSTLSLRRATHEALHGRGLLPFLSTLSLRRATASDISVRREARISIHALLAESDSCK